MPPRTSTPLYFLWCHNFYDFPELFGGITDCRLTSTGQALQVKWLSPALRKLSLLEQHANQLLPDVQKWNNDVKQPMFWWTGAAEVYFSENLCSTELMPPISDSMHSTNIHSRASMPVHSLVVWIANWKQNFEQTMDFEQSGHTNQLCFLPEFKLPKLLPTRRFISWSGLHHWKPQSPLEFVPLRGLACLCACLPQRTCLQNLPWDSADSLHPGCQKIFIPIKSPKLLFWNLGSCLWKKIKPQQVNGILQSTISPEKHPAIKERLSDF